MKNRPDSNQKHRLARSTTTRETARRPCLLEPYQIALYSVIRPKRFSPDTHDHEIRLDADGAALLKGVSFGPKFLSRKIVLGAR